jgi:hypothetical protein
MRQRRICTVDLLSLFFQGEIDGIMELFSHNVVEPDEDLLQMVEALGSQIGLFIARGRIVQELQREKENAGAAKHDKRSIPRTVK